MADRIAIVGSRHYRLMEAVRVFVARLPTDTVVISGGAEGVDRWAEIAARERGLTVQVFPADWKTHGRRAGPLRNAEIVTACSRLVAFWDGQSRGTLNTVLQAHDLGRSIVVFGPDGEQLELKGVLGAAERLGVSAALRAATDRVIGKAKS